MTYRLGVDVGGTFTDLLLVDEDTGDTHRAKTPSTPADQSIGVLVGIDKVCALAGIEPAQIDHVMHGTTVATNAVLEGKGARVGLIVTRGYRQVLQVARSFVPGGLAAWIVWPKPEPLAALENTVEAVERVGARGEVVEELDEADLLPKLAYLRELGVDAVTVALINSFANPAHERRIAELVAPGDPGRADLAEQRDPAGDQGVRADADHGGQLVRPPDGRAATWRAWRRPCSASRSAAPCTCCARTAGWPRWPPRPRRRCSCSCPARPAASPARCGWPGRAASRTCSPSTWAAPAPTSRWCRTAGPGSAGRRRSARSTSGRPPWTSARSAPAAGRSRTCPS